MPSDNQMLPFCSYRGGLSIPSRSTKRRRLLDHLPPRQHALLIGRPWDTDASGSKSSAWYRVQRSVDSAQRRFEFVALAIGCAPSAVIPALALERGSSTRKPPSIPYPQGEGVLHAGQGVVNSESSVEQTHEAPAGSRTWAFMPKPAHPLSPIFGAGDAQRGPSTPRGRQPGSAGCQAPAPERILQCNPDSLVSPGRGPPRWCRRVARKHRR
jgi:hypothetical protein